jgi:hypothetical protein
MAQVTATISSGGPATFCTGNNVQLSSTIVPASVYQYQWMKDGNNISGANASSYTAAISGSYVLKATALNSTIYNSNAISVTVNSLPTAPNITYNSPAIICNGGSINLTDNLSTNVSFQWYFNNNPISNAITKTYSATTGGNYKLIITNLTTGCSNTSQNVIVGEMPYIVDNTIVTCGNSTTISLTNPNFNYSTLPSTCNVDMSGASIVDTNVGGSGGGSQRKIICYGGNLTANSGSSTFVVEYGGTLNGFGGGGSNTAYIKSGGIYNYNSGGGGGNVIYYEPGAIINAGTTQTVQCSSIGVIYPTNTSNLCNNLTYLWSNGATTPTITVNPTQPTTYSVTVSNGSISCTDQVLVSPAGVTPTISASGSTTFCQGGSVVLTSSSTAGNTWSNGATTQSITVTNGGSYSVTVSNGNCSVTSTSTVVTVNSVPSTPTISASGPTTFCQGGSVLLTSSSTTGNTWSNGATTQSITVTNGGSYSVTVSNGNCSVTSTSTVVTVNSVPSVILTPINNYIDVNSSPIQLNGTPNGGTFTGLGVVGSIFYPATAGLGSNTITYNYTNNSGCSNSANQSIIVYDITGSTCATVTISMPILGLTSPNNINTITIYPNPAHTNITIDFGNFIIMNGYTIKINNSLGQQVFTGSVNQQSSNIDVSTLSGAGFYYLSIIDPQSNTVAVRKIVLQ